MIIELNEKIVYDKQGRKKEIIIPYDEYQKLIKLLEDFDDIDAMKEVESDDSVPWDHVKKDLRKKGKI